MITIRKSNDRGHNDLGWLDTRYTFSFADYFDPKHMGFRSLRVINEDHVAPGKGFGMHPHKNMEIITYVLEGELQHKDSMGHGAVVRPGEVQHMSAGTGILHSEFNPSATKPVHLLQIWIMPGQDNLKPSYDQKSFADQIDDGGSQLVASRDGRDGSIHINQDADLSVLRLSSGDSSIQELKPGRHGWLQVARGSVTAGGVKLEAGDGAAISDEQQVKITANGNAEALWFDLA